MKTRNTGRSKAEPAKSTSVLSYAIAEAASRHGSDGKGTDGLVGYCRFLAENHPTSFATLLGKVLPMQIAGSAEGPVHHQFTVKFIRPNGNPVS